MLRFDPNARSEYSNELRTICQLDSHLRFPDVPVACKVCHREDTKLFYWVCYTPPISGQWRFKVSNVVLHNHRDVTTPPPPSVRVAM